MALGVVDPLKTESMPENAPHSDFVKLIEPDARRAASLARALEGRVQNAPKESGTG